MSRVVTIGSATLYLGDSMEIMPTLGRFGHIVCDPAYEKILHDSKTAIAGRRHRTDGRADLKALDFPSIDEIRDAFVALVAKQCDGWFIAFCTVEGTAKWADAINPSTINYKRACIWIKPDSAPQLNGQGPAQGAECFVTAWAGPGYSRWNGRGKRGVYTHMTNNKERHGGHPAEKPRRLMSEILADFTLDTELVCDPFMGSGTTGVAAVMRGQPFIGIEGIPAYFEIACERIERAHAQRDLFAAPAALTPGKGKPLLKAMLGITPPVSAEKPQGG